MSCETFLLRIDCLRWSLLPLILSFSRTRDTVRPADFEPPSKSVCGPCRNRPRYLRPSATSRRLGCAGASRAKRALSGGLDVAVPNVSVGATLDSNLQNIMNTSRGALISYLLLGFLLIFACGRSAA